MSWIEALIFGIIQGITEFLPVSSTAHLVIAELLFGYEFPGLSFEIYLHLASILAVIIYFRNELIEITSGTVAYLRHRSRADRGYFIFCIYLLVATIITGGLGLVLKGLVIDIMKTPPFIAGALTITGFFLVAIERLKSYGQRKESEMRLLDAVFVGLGQTLAVLPGISRSGSTLIAALWVGLSRETAVRFSFILAVPVILGSSVLSLGELSRGFGQEIGAGALTISFISSFIFSVIGIALLIDLLKKGRLLYLAIYCFLLALSVVTFMSDITF